MNLEHQRARNGKSGAPALSAKTPSSELDAHGDYHERELRLIAAFRLRDAANRIATLVGMSDSPKLRAELLALYDRLMGEERELLVRSMETVRFKAHGPAAKVTKKTA